MAIEWHEAPSSALQAVDRVLKALAATSGFRTPKLREAVPSDLELTRSHRVAVLSVKEAKSITPLRVAGQTDNWRFLIAAKQQSLAAIEAVRLAADHPSGQFKGGDYRFGNLNEGPFVGATVEALERAEGIQGSLEPLLLVVPGLSAVALWLHGRTNDDFLMPLPPVLVGLQPYEPLPPNAFFGALKELSGRIATGSHSGG